MWWILVNNKSGRERFYHREDPLEIGRDRVVGIASEVDLDELHAETTSADWQSPREPYERALSLYEDDR